MKLTRIPCRTGSPKRERKRDREIGRKRERERESLGGERGEKLSGGKRRGRVNEHSLFSDARCGCRLSQPYHPQYEPEEKGSANREIDG